MFRQNSRFPALHIEYQSTTRPDDIHRFFQYDSALFDKYKAKIQTFVLYTNQIRNAVPKIDANVFQYHIRNVYLSEFDGDTVLNEMLNNIEHDEWNTRDNGKLAFLLHMHFQRLDRQVVIARMVDIVERIPNKDDQMYIAFIIDAFSGKDIINLKEEENFPLEAILKMGELYQDLVTKERIEAVKAVAKKLLEKNIPLKDIADATELSEEEILQIQKQMKH